MTLHNELEELIRLNEVKSVRTYARRQQLEMSRQQLDLEIKRVEQELILLDGELRGLELVRASQEEKREEKREFHPADLDK